MNITFKPLAAGYPTDREKDEALEFILFLKYKYDGSVKAQAHTYGRIQRPGQFKENATSQTVSLESVLSTSVIKAYKGREVTIIDVPRDFPTVDQHEVINIKL